MFPNKESITYYKCKTECHYLSAVIHEGLRIFLVIGGTPTRLVPNGGKVIDGYYIPEKTVAGVCFNALHNLPAQWEKPEAFDPQRWLFDGKFKTNNNFSPFLIGPRACVGRTLALMELYLVNANLIRNFTFNRNGEKGVGHKCFIATQPVEPIKVSITKNQGKV